MEYSYFIFGLLFQVGTILIWTLSESGFTIMYFFPLLFIIYGFGLNCLAVLYYTMEFDSSLEL